eukprot:scaffold117995_cov32-Tisochrysis_lutea.AAC.4
MCKGYRLTIVLGVVEQERALDDAVEPSTALWFSCIACREDARMRASPRCNVSSSSHRAPEAAAMRPHRDGLQASKGRDEYLY